MSRRTFSIALALYIILLGSVVVSGGFNKLPTCHVSVEEGSNNTGKNYTFTSKECTLIFEQKEVEA